MNIQTSSAGPGGSSARDADAQQCVPTGTSSTCATPSNCTSYVIAHPKGNFASGRMEDPSFFTKISHKVRNFREKEHHVPRCRRRIGPFIQTTPGLHAHRVTRVIQRSLAGFLLPR
jgi:hypothetical protein